jgi:tetratricopeptide (TPR) repeat protein
MIRVLFASACLVLWCANAQAGSLDDFKAAKAAVEQGQSEEAIRLFTSALAVGDLSPDDQLAARHLRGREYTVRSMIADSFQRSDRAVSLRNDAIADFTAAIALKGDDDGLYVARGAAHHLNGQYEAAVADFDAALKLKTTTVTLVQRGAALRAKGDYERAVADYSAALANEPRDPSDSAAQIHNERAFAQFLAGRFDQAAADFEKGMTLGASAHTGDALWMPYQAAWLHIARARAGEDDAAELARNAAKIDLKQWPGTLVAYFLGQLTLDQVSPHSSHGAMARGRACNMAVFSGQMAMIKKDAAAAEQQFKGARKNCNIHTVQYLAAGVELKRLDK